MSVSERIKVARSMLEITQEQLAKISGVSLPRIKQYESRGANMTLETLYKLAEALKVSPEYLVAETGTSPSEKINQSKSAESPVELVKIPYYPDFSASAGRGAVDNDIGDFEVRELPRNFLRNSFGITNNYDKTFIMRSRGDSMSPIIPEGSFLVVQNVGIQDGDIGVFRIDGEIYVKRFVRLPKIKLLSENPNYDPIHINEDMALEPLGRVVGYYRVLD